MLIFCSEVQELNADTPISFIEDGKYRTVNEVHPPNEYRPNVSIPFPKLIPLKPSLYINASSPIDLTLSANVKKVV